jgi:hypothetical protein
MPNGHGRTKLNTYTARQIRERFAAGESAAKLAADFGVSDQAIKDIVNFETWVGAGGPKPAHLVKEGKKSR